MKQFITIILTLVFALQTFSRYLVIADYSFNTSAYVKNCVNKAKPVLKCNGKCQLMKKIQAEEKKETENTEKKGNEIFQTLSSKSFFLAHNTIPSSFIKRTYPVLKSPKAIHRTLDIFRPPSC